MTERDNESRLGIGAQEPVPTVPADKGTGLDFAMPTELVDLPSEGKFYPPNHPLRDKKELEIKYMTAKEEDILTSKSLLKKGLAIDKMLESLIVDKKVKLEDLILGDKNALILAARKSGYGPRYETQVECPKCEKKNKFGFDLDKVANKKIEEVVGATETGNGTFLILLPRTKVQVEVKPMTGREEKSLADIQEQRKKLGASEGASTTQMKLFIVAIVKNDEKHITRSVIDAFVDAMPASDAKFLRDSYKKLIPDVDMNQTFSCSACDYEEVIEIPLTTDFFWPK